jgi:hypothetical protein
MPSIILLKDHGDDVDIYDDTHFYRSNKSISSLMKNSLNSDGCSIG